MQQNHAKALKGMSIAVIVLSGLSILGCVTSLVSVFGLGGGVLGALSPSNMGGYGSYSDAVDIMLLSMAMGGAFFGWALVCSIVTLVGGIVGLRNGAEPSKLGTVFGWSIAGAILSLLFGNLVGMTLFIIMAVFAHKDKELAASGCYQQAAYGGQAFYAAPAMPYGMPMASGAPMAQPMPMQPAPPMQPMPQPMQPAPPAQPMPYPPANPPLA